MQKKIILPVLAAIVGLVLAIGGTAFTHIEKRTKPNKLTTVYYQFIGTDDNAADQISNWAVITQAQYDALSCSKNHRACAIAALSTLTSVPYTQQSGYKDPIVSGAVTEVRNRVTNL